jgi:hypothetical protein
MRKNGRAEKRPVPKKQGGMRKGQKDSCSAFRLEWLYHHILTRNGQAIRKSAPPRQRSEVQGGAEGASDRIVRTSLGLCFCNKPDISQGVRSGVHHIVFRDRRAIGDRIPLQLQSGATRDPHFAPPGKNDDRFLIPSCAVPADRSSGRKNHVPRSHRTGFRRAV